MKTPEGGPQSQQQLPMPRTPATAGASHQNPAIPTSSHVPNTAGHVSSPPLSMAPPPQLEPYSNPYNHIHPQNNYLYNASYIPPPTVTYPNRHNFNPNAHSLHGIIPHPYYYSIPQSHGSGSSSLAHLNPQ